MTTTPTSGAADLPKALRLAEEITELMCSTEAAARTIAAAADELVRLHALAAGRATAAQAVAEPADTVVLNAAMRAIQQAIELIGAPTDERMRAVRRVLRGAVIVAEDDGKVAPLPSTAYAALPAPNYPKSGGFPGTFAEAQMRAFADATHTLRASHGQAPAQPAAQQGVAYAEMPDLSDANGEIWSAIIYWKHAERGEDALRKASELERVLSDQMRAFADATHTLRASHGQAPAQPATVHCKGRNCAAVDGDGHSDECASDHERAASGLDTAGNRNPVARYDGYRGAPCNPAYTKDQRAAWLEGYEARNRQGITPSPQADSVLEDAALWFAERDNVLHSFWVLLGEAEVHADNDNNPLLKHQVEEFYRQWNALNGTTLGPRWVSRAARKQGGA